MCARPLRLGGFIYRGAYRYSLCFVLRQRVCLFVDAPVVALATTQILHSAAECHFDVLAFCFMPDHLHLVVEGTRDDSDLRRFVKVTKQRVTFHARGTLRVPMAWQDGYFEHVLRSDETTERVVRYVLENPVRTGIVRHAEDHPFSWAKFWPEPT